MRLTFLGTTSGNHGCPTVFATDRDTFVVQGNKITDPEALATMQSRGNGIPEHETAVEVPRELLLKYLDQDNA
ncbi:MAG: hypothetical protein ACRDRL_22530 [Sciscionella sp.]